MHHVASSLCNLQKRREMYKSTLPHPLVCNVPHHLRHDYMWLLKNKRKQPYHNEAGDEVWTCAGCDFTWKYDIKFHLHAQSKWEAYRSSNCPFNSRNIARARKKYYARPTCDYKVDTRTKSIAFEKKVQKAFSHRLATLKAKQKQEDHDDDIIIQTLHDMLNARTEPPSPKARKCPPIYESDSDFV